MNSIAEELLDLLKQASGGVVYLAGAAKCHVSEWTEWDRKARAAITRAEAALAAPQPDADGWIPWAGGECPVDPEAYVQVRYADGVIDDELQEAEYFNWEHSYSRGSSVFNISAYRVFVPRK